MTADLTIEIDEPDHSTLTLAAGAAGRTLEAYVADLVHAEAVRLRQAEAFGRLADQRITVKDTWFPSVVQGEAGDQGEPVVDGPVEDELDD